MLEVRKLSFAYGKHPLLRDVSFVVSPGEVIGLVGANGVGKSTLLKILATVIMPAVGQVLIEGRDVARNPLVYRSLIGYMQEIPALYEEMTPKAYLKYCARLKGEPEKRIRRRMMEASELCHLTEFQEIPIGKLSFGQKKRVALADALLLRPRVLLLDDLCAGLDAAMREAMAKIITAATAFSCVIVSGHELMDMLQWSTQVLVLKDGVIAGTLPVAGTEKVLLASRVTSLIKGGTK